MRSERSFSSKRKQGVPFPTSPPKKKPLFPDERKTNWESKFYLRHFCFSRLHFNFRWFVVASSHIRIEIDCGKSHFYVKQVSCALQCLFQSKDKHSPANNKNSILKVCVCLWQRKLTNKKGVILFVMSARDRWQQTNKRAWKQVKIDRAHPSFDTL